MNKDFPRMITLLRKERNLSQKQAAEELGISQALLSHYEKGVRECGLDFVIRASEYYNVSCDYLLGRSADREYELKDPEGENVSSTQSAAHIINRRLLSSMLNVIYDMTACAKSRQLDRAVTNYLMITVYRLFRQLGSSAETAAHEHFTIPKCYCNGYSEAAMAKLYADITAMTEKAGESYIPSLEQIETTPEHIAATYPETAGEIFNVIRQAENNIAKTKLSR